MRSSRHEHATSRLRVAEESGGEEEAWAEELEKSGVAFEVTEEPEEVEREEEAEEVSEINASDKSFPNSWTRSNGSFLFCQ